jgi:hypothetical protein
MADRTMVQGDLYPPMRGQASDETGVLDLTTAASLQFRMKSGATSVTGVAVADTPPITDADGIHHWNWHYIWVAGDTATVGTYFVELVATWAGSKPQHFIGPTLVIQASNT